MERKQTTTSVAGMYDASVKQDDGPKLKRTMGMWKGAAVIFNATVGSGIFVSAGTVVKDAGSIGVALLMWILNGILVGLGSMMYTELGTKMPKAGGDYEYIYQSIGEYFGFLFCFTRLLLIIPSGLAISGLTLAEYLIKPADLCSIGIGSKICIACCVLLFFAFINCRSVKTVELIQLAFALGKAIALLGIVVTGIYNLIAGTGTQNFQNAFEGTNSFASVMTAFYGCSFAYSGWNYLNLAAEELEKPERDLKRAAILAVSCVALLYVFTNVAYFSSLDKNTIITSPAIAVEMMSKFHKYLGPLFSVLVSLSIFGSTNSIIFTTSRLVFGAAREGQMPIALCFLHWKYLTPINSIAIVTLTSIIYMLIGDIDLLLYMSTFCETFFYVVTFVSFLYLRYLDGARKRKWTEKEWENYQDRKSKVYEAPLWAVIIFGVVTTAICVFGIVREPLSMIFCIAFMIFGAFIYHLSKKPFTRQAKRNMDEFFRFLQKLTYSGVSREGDEIFQ